MALTDTAAVQGYPELDGFDRRSSSELSGRPHGMRWKMQNKEDRKRIYVLMAVMTVAAVISVVLETMEARARQYVDVEIYEDGGEKYLFLPFWANGEAEAARYEGLNVHVMQSENLASIEIDTQSGSLNYISEDRENAEQGRITCAI